jgi:hypothetical protein
LPEGHVGEVYSAEPAATGGSGSYSWKKLAGPSWLTIEGSGKLTGTPPSAGTVKVLVELTDRETGASVSKELELKTVSKETRVEA